MAAIVAEVWAAQETHRPEASEGPGLPVPEPTTVSPRGGVRERPESRHEDGKGRGRGAKGRGRGKGGPEAHYVMSNCHFGPAAARNIRGEVLLVAALTREQGWSSQEVLPH